MSSSASVPVVASRRIRAFAATMWIIGGIAMAIMATATIGRIGVDPFSGELFVSEGNRYMDPWESRAIPDAEHVEGTGVWSGTGPALIQVRDGELADSPVVVRNLGSRSVSLYMSDRVHDRSELPLQGYEERPDYMGLVSVDSERLVVPMAGLELWIDTEQPWELEIFAAPIEPLVGTMTGASSAYLRYDGDALSGTFAHVGPGLVVVEVIQPDGTDTPIIEDGTFEQRFSWRSAPWTIFYVEVVGREEGRWQFSADERVPAPGQGPALGPDPAPTGPELAPTPPATEGTP